MAAQNGHFAVVELLVKEGQAYVNQADDGGETPLFMAAKNDHTAVVELLVKEGQADVNHAMIDGGTPLILAVQNGHTAVVELLVKEGHADVNQASNDGVTPLLRASGQGHTAIIELLIKGGHANVNQAMNNGGTPLHIAAQLGHIAIVELLVKEGQVDVNQAMNNGGTPLFIAASQGHIAVVELLVKEGQADVNQATNIGGTPLFVASLQGHIAIVELLVKEGQADVNQADNRGEAPLQTALRHGHHDIVRILTEHKDRGTKNALDVFFDSNPVQPSTHDHSEWMCALCETVNQNDQHECQCCGEFHAKKITDSCENKEDRSQEDASLARALAMSLEETHVDSGGGGGGSMATSVNGGHTHSADRRLEAPTTEPPCRVPAPEQEDATWDKGLIIVCYGPLSLYLMHLDRRLDNGGFGVVYQVQSRPRDDDPTLRHYAAKRSKHVASFGSAATASVTNTSMTTGGRDELSVAMQEEAQIILQVVPHENILDLVDMAHVKGVPVLITLWGDGGSLDTFLENNIIGVLSVDVMLGLSIQLCRGLRHLHDSGVVHYDLKPANVIVFTPQSEHNDQNEHVLKVADFGLSRGLTKTGLGKCPKMS
jgi:ankyrin repeat protein